MSRRKAHPLRALSEEEQTELARISRERNGSADQVTRAKLLLLVSAGSDYQTAAVAVGRRDGDRVSALVRRFNAEGLGSLLARHGGGLVVKYDVAERERILRDVRRTPTCEHDGTASWSRSTLQRSLQTAEDGLPTVREFTLRKVLLEAGYDWQQSRSWCQTGQVVRQRKAGSVVVTDPDGEAKKTD